jgi:hypothetical protein
VYGIEVSVTALAADGMPIDRAAFLSFEVPPVNAQIDRVRYMVGGAVLMFIVFLVVVIFTLRARKRRSR